MKQRTISYYFFIREKKLNQKGLATIYVRISDGGKPTEISLGRRIPPEQWNSKKQCVKGKNEDSRSINSYLQVVKRKLQDAEKELLEEGRIRTSLAIKHRYLGEDEKYQTLLAIAEYHNDQMEGSLGTDYRPGTYKNYKTTLKYLKEFIPYQYRTDDIFLKQLNHKFIADYDYWLKTEKPCTNNGAVKHLQRLKKIVNMAIRNEWLNFDPFAKHTMTIKKVDPRYLTEDELELIETADLDLKQHRLVRDVFIFACYTGFSYSDVAKFTPEDIRIGIDREKWLFTYRSKTDIKANVPLLPKALEIIERYKEHKLCVSNEKLLPVFSNQKINSYLKDIAVKLKIKKKLTFHVARHTFATTVLLMNDVPIESVSDMLGHATIKQTQVYAKVLQKKVSSDMKTLKAKLDSKKQSNTVAK